MAEQSNAASEKQVKKAISREERLRFRQIEDLRAVLKSQEGRRVLWRIMEECKTFSSAHHPSGSQVYYNIGRQDLGHFLMSEITSVDAKQFLNMMNEAKDYENV